MTEDTDRVWCCDTSMSRPLQALCRYDSDNNGDRYSDGEASRVQCCAVIANVHVFSHGRIWWPCQIARV